MSTSEDLAARIADLESQLADARIASPTAPKPVDRNDGDPSSWAAFGWRGLKGIATLWHSGPWARTLMVVVTLLVGAILALIYLPTSTLAVASKAADASPLGVPPKDIGLTAMWIGSFTDIENQRLSTQIRNAKTIKLMAYNADQFIQNFSPEFEEFFNHGDTTMQVLLADPSDSFYVENTKFVLKRDLSAAELASYQRHLDDVVSRLRTLERNKGKQVEIRLFKNQMRVPIVILDDKICILTLRLPPFESKQSLRMEFDNTPHGFNSNCITHFNQLWGISHSSSKILAKP